MKATKCSFCGVAWYKKFLVFSIINPAHAICKDCIKLGKQLIKPVKVIK